MDADTAPLRVLADASASLAAITSALANLSQTPEGRPCFRVGIASNVVIDTAGTYLRRHGWLEGIRIDVKVGTYDDSIGNVERFAKDSIDAVLLHLLFDNLSPSFEAQIAMMSDEAVAAKLDELQSRLDITLAAGRAVPRLVMVRFHRITQRNGVRGHDGVDVAIDRFNDVLDSLPARHPNLVLVDVADIIAAHGEQRCIDWRFYFRGKAPYSLEFLDAMARRIVLATRVFGTQFRKALVLDCDNTLWGGIVGEDLVRGIKLDPFDYPGNVYWRVQNELLAMQRSGVLLCIASKNNPRDVEAVFEGHPNTVLRSQDFIVRMLNWEAKDENLRAIASSLNIGLDSLVFLDDSPFECELVRGQLPMVRTFQVPKSLPDYPRLLQEIRALFGADSTVTDTATKTAQYLVRAAAESDRGRFASQAEYLASLNIKLKFSCNERSSAPRISELTMKSNQFNLTTHRYTQAQILDLMGSSASAVYSFSVSDRFGDSGLTGVAIVRFRGTVAIIDSFLMSCRIIGRSIELAVWDFVVAAARGLGATTIEADYLPTAKNAQVAQFYDRLIARPVRIAEDGARHYRAALGDVATSAPSWIEVLHAQ